MRPVVQTHIGRKIALAVGVPVLLAGLGGIALSWVRAQEILETSAADEAAAIADLVAASFTVVDPATVPAGTARDGRTTVHRQVPITLRADYPVLEAARVLRVIDPNGVVRWSRRVEELGTKLGDAERILSAPPEGMTNPAAGEHVRPLGGMGCARCHGGDSFRLGAVQVLVPRAPVADDLERLFRVVAVYGLLLYVALILASALALRRLATRPLARLVEVMRRAERGDFLVRAQVESDDEIGGLAKAFNSMLGRLTELKATEIENARELETMQRELVLKAELERQHAMIEEANQALSRRVRDVTLLLDISRSLNSSLDIHEILNLVTEMVGVTVGVDQFSVMLLDEKTQRLKLAASFGLKVERLAGFELPVGQGASGLAAQAREPIYIADVKTDPRYVRGPADPDGDASVLCAPMIWKEQLVGVMSFVRKARAAFTENDIVLLQLVGGQAALAIVNARLYTETKELSQTDELTGLFNRRSLFSRLEMELARAQRFGKPLSLLMVDIDHFKHLNDTSGHPAGDKILEAVARLLHDNVRKVDTVARYGGEEFMLLLPQNDRPEALEVGEKLRRAVERTEFEHGERQPGGRLTISVGCATFPGDGGTLEALVDAVDSALYASKRAGRNRVTAFAPGMELHPGRERGPHAAATEAREKAAG